MVSVNGPSKKVETVLSERIPLPRDTKFGVFAAAWYAPAEPTAKIDHSGRKLQGRFNWIFFLNFWSLINQYQNIFAEKKLEIF